MNIILFVICSLICFFCGIICGVSYASLKASNAIDELASMTEKNDKDTYYSLGVTDAAEVVYRHCVEWWRK